MGAGQQGSASRSSFFIGLVWSRATGLHGRDTRGRRRGAHDGGRHEGLPVSGVDPVQLTAAGRQATRGRHAGSRGSYCLGMEVATGVLHRYSSVTHQGQSAHLEDQRAQQQSHLRLDEIESLYFILFTRFFTGGFQQQQDSERVLSPIFGSARGMRPPISSRSIVGGRRGAMPHP